jgi:hypothetical protein
MGEFTRYLETAAEKYDKVVFKTDAIFNEPAPEPYVAFIIGGVSHCLITALIGNLCRVVADKVFPCFSAGRFCRSLDF